ncbi:unnamed protein product [Didymodactylos carnosus]|uniref:Uncharacterized protein n=1 Tax=Didymodactylos carnosus TaxID=1234261 RepID=A0A813SCH4_9BILA|nr:unnamed protein product [Didymodactylos carnosus]CAF0793180.1 unnamed protein product [Didymodactylos carnosus]CAF3501492.1 unnamed protein product [Didymodactylos carnosus]CAF3577562.1 unnamed protein product [Didymodactylos carnosus]
MSLDLPECTSVVVQNNVQAIQPSSEYFVIPTHSSPIIDSTIENIRILHDESFQSSSTSNSKGSSSNSKSSSSSAKMFHRIHQASDFNSPLMFSRCTSIDTLSSYGIQSINESYTSECSSVKPSGIISPSDLPASPGEESPTHGNTNATLMNHTANYTIIEKTILIQNCSREESFCSYADMDNPDEVKLFKCEDSEMHSRRPLNADVMDNDEEAREEYSIKESNNFFINNDNSTTQTPIQDNMRYIPTLLCARIDNPNGFDTSPYDNIVNDDSFRVYNTQCDDDFDDSTSLSNDLAMLLNKTDEQLFHLHPHHDLSIIKEESSMIDDKPNIEKNSNEEDENSIHDSIQILYNLIKKPHWTRISSSPPQLPDRTRALSPSEDEVDTDKYTLNEEDDYDYNLIELSSQMIQNDQKRSFSNDSVQSNLSTSHQRKKRCNKNESERTHLAASFKTDYKQGNENDPELEQDDEYCSDENDDYDVKKGQELIRAFIRDTLSKKSSNQNHSSESIQEPETICCPLNTPLTTSNSSSNASSTKSCSFLSASRQKTTYKEQENSNYYRSKSTPALTKPRWNRDTYRSKQDICKDHITQSEHSSSTNIIQVHQTRTSELRLRQAQQKQQRQQQRN